MRIETIKEKYNAEIALIVLCCRHYLNTAENGSLQLFIQKNKIDWKQFYQLSAAHRIRPVVYKILNPFKECINPENLLELHNYCVYFNAFALNNKRELNRILKILKQNNISGKPFKGIDFAENIYGDIGLREFSDNDIIIEEIYIDKIVTIMAAEGYLSKDILFYKRFPKQYIRDYKDLLFEKNDGIIREFAFEFHFKPSRYFQGYPYTFSELLGDNYIHSSKNFNVNDYLKVMTINNGLMDFYPDIHSVLDLTILLMRAKEHLINDMDPILIKYFNYGRDISANLFLFPSSIVKTKTDYHEFYFSNHLQNDILQLKIGKRTKILQYIYFRVKNTESVKLKITLLKNFIQLIARPNLDDITGLKLPYYFLYYFTKPFRMVFKIFK